MDAVHTANRGDASATPIRIDTSQIPAVEVMLLSKASWTEFNIWGLLGFGATVPANGTVCLIARDIRDRRIIGVARFVRKGLSVHFEQEDGTRYSLWDVSGWMDAKPLADFLKNPTATVYA